ncbi:hypothetical protein ACXYMX_09140 [Sporosarcina sp. CAU 1771]
MKKRILTLGSALLIIVLSACGDIEEKNTREVQPSDDVVAAEETDAVEVEEQQEAEVEEEVEEKAKPIGTRSSPLPFGDTITVKERIYDDSYNGYDAHVDITLLETIRGDEAWALIEKENMFNDPAEEGFEYAMLKVKGFLKDAETEDDSLYFNGMSFKFVSQEGEVYDWAMVVVPNELTKELYNGGTAEGYIANQVKIGDDFKVSYDSSEGSPVFFFVN